MNRTRWFLAGLALVALAVLACSPREEPGRSPEATPTPAATGTEEPSPGPGDETPADRPPSDLPPELAAILSEVAALRGLEPPPSLDARVVARADIPALLEELKTEADREYYRTTTTLYRLMGQFDLDQDYESIFDSFGSEAVLGLYSPARETLWVVSDSGDLNDLSDRERSTLAHELVHILQDYHFDLDAVYEGIGGNLDRELAWSAAIEGDAEIHEADYTSDVSARAGSTVLLLGGRPQIPGVPASFIREMFFPYETGSGWARRVRDSQGIQAINELIAEPPVGTSVILHPELLDTDWAPRQVTLPDLAPALGAAWQRESGGSLGEFRWMNYLQMEVTGVTAATAADGWDGDAYDVYANGTDSAAVFRIAFRDEDEAEEFRNAHEEFIAASAAAITAEDDLTVAGRRNGFATVLQTDAGGADVFVSMGSSAAIAVQVLQSLLNA